MKQVDRKVKKGRTSGKGKTSQVGQQSKTATAAKEVVVEAGKLISDKLEGAVVMELHALFDIALHYPDVKLLHVRTMETVVNSITDRIHNAFSASELHLPRVEVEVDTALSAVDHITELMNAGATGVDLIDSPECISREALGRCLYAFTCDIAFALERTQEALGEVAGVGFRESHGDYRAHLAREQQQAARRG